MRGGLEGLQNRQLLLDQIIRENGVTYNLHNQGDTAGRLWMMDILPLVVDFAEMERCALVSINACDSSI
ncbi:MAG: hypothetical protein LR011_04555 [Verrucomicrobia bacterium]|nr:hypothetical protein [Verrucomicrobiota bacterium]